MNIKDKVEIEQEIIKTTWKCGTSSATVEKNLS